MNADTLRTILLVKAVEEQDRDGSLLTVAERDQATREAVRRWPLTEKATGTRLDRERHTWRVLGARAEELYARLAQRHPVVVHTVKLERSARRAVLSLLVVAFVAGFLLSLFDSRVRIEIVAFPLLGLILWNLVVYATLVVAAVRRARAGSAPTAGTSLATWPARWAWRRAGAVVRQSAFYHRPLAAALRVFADEWWPLAQPLLWRHGKRLFHAGAAAIAVGLIAGYYVRGIGLEYRAGWESTFLHASQVGTLLHVLYGPAAALTGIVLPADTAAVEALRWREGAGGGPAATWIHLMAATALLYIIVPRTLLALWAALSLVRASANVVPPDSLRAYARGVIDGDSLVLPAEHVSVTPYAYRPEPRSVDGLRRLLQAAWGTGTQVELQPAVAYGSEHDYVPRPAGAGVDVESLLFNLAATPEVENHGDVLGRARDARDTEAPRLLVLVDESAYLDTMQGDSSLEGRIEERREAWRSFVRRHACEPCLVHLAALADGATIEDEIVRRVRSSSRQVTT